MTPEERKLVTDLFDRLATLEDAQRDPDAERLMQDGLRQAPNALYALVQTVLVQDEALKRADARIRDLEHELDGGREEPPRDTSFLGGMRDSLLGRRSSVPPVRSSEAGPGEGMSQTQGSGGPGLSPAWRTGAPAGAPGYPAGAPGYGAPPPGYGGAPMAPGGMAPGGMAPGGMAPGGSFLGNAAAAAAGAIGGSLLMNGIRNLMGGHAPGSAHAAADPSIGGSSGSFPLGSSGSATGSSAAGSDLSRQAGAGDIGRTPAAPTSNEDTSHGTVNDAHAAEDDQDDEALEPEDLEDEDYDFDDDDGGDEE